MICTTNPLWIERNPRKCELGRFPDKRLLLYSRIAKVLKIGISFGQLEAIIAVQNIIDWEETPNTLQRNVSSAFYGCYLPLKYIFVSHKYLDQLFIKKSNNIFQPNQTKTVMMQDQWRWRLQIRTIKSLEVFLC